MIEFGGSGLERRPSLGAGRSVPDLRRGQNPLEAYHSAGSMEDRADQSSRFAFHGSGLRPPLSRSPRSQESLHLSLNSSVVTAPGSASDSVDLLALVDSLSGDTEHLRSLLRIKQTASRFDYKSRINELMDYVEALKNGLAQQLSAMKDVRSAIVPMQAKINTRLTLATEELSAQRADGQQLNAELAAVRQKASSYDTRVDELHQALRDARLERKQAFAETAQRVEACQAACRREVAEIVDSHQKQLDEVSNSWQRKIDEASRRENSLLVKLERSASREQELESRCSELERLRSTKEQQVQVVQSQVGEKDSLLKQRSADLRKVEEMLGKREADLCELRARIAEKDGALTQRNAELQEMTQRYTEEAKLVAKREDILHALKARVEEQQLLLRDADNKIRDADAREHELQLMMEDRDMELRKRADDIQDLEEQCREQAMVVGEQQGEMKALRAKCGDYDSQLTMRSSELADLRAQLNSERAASGQKELELHAANARVDEKTNLVGETLAVLSQREKELAIVKSQGTTMEGQLKVLHGQLREREEMISRTRDELQALQTRLHEKERSWEDRLREKDELVREKDRDLRESIHSITQMHGDNNQQLHLERQRSAKLEQEVQVSRANELGLHETVRSMEKDLEAHKAQALSNELAVSELRSSLSLLERERDQLAEMAARSQEEQTELNTAVQVTKKELLKAKGELTDRTREAAALSKARDALQAEFKAYRSTVEERQASLAAQRGTVESLREHVLALESRLATAEKARRDLHNTVQELRGSIRVYCRVRPAPNGAELAVECTDQDRLSVTYNEEQYAFAYDRVFGPLARQEEVFDEVSSMVQSALDGYKVCIFAYGQTGSGKTFTMQGAPSSWGLIPRSLSKIFDAGREMCEDGWSWSMQASFFEVYNETFRDLLQTSNNSCPTSAANMHSIKHDEAWGAIVTNMSSVEVDCLEQIRRLTSQAAKQRSVGATDLNSVSSRSHAVFALYLRGTNRRQNTELHGALHLVDLAGSERLDKSGSTGDRLKETQNINRSLSSLADVFLAKAEKRAHVPFRNSKLTHLMEPCLSGQGKTMMLVNVCEDEFNAHETLCSLRFASQVHQCTTGGKARRTVKALGEATTPRRASQPVARLTSGSWRRSSVPGS